MEKHHCIRDIDNDFIIKNAKKFELLHQRKGAKLIKWESYVNDLIIIPVTINICLDSKDIKINFIKYSQQIIDILNDGFSGNIYCKYKNNNNDHNFIYNKEYIKSILDKQNIKDSEKYAETIYNNINNRTDTNIKFYLHSIVFHDVFLEMSFDNNDTEEFMKNIAERGFKLRDFHKKNLNINIMSFRCSTLGISIFPWMKYLSENIPGYMQVFLDYSTIHPDIGINKFNQCRTLIHEVGHVLGLRHTFNCTEDSLTVYSIILGKIIAEKEILNKINYTNYVDIINSATKNNDNKNKNDNNNNNNNTRDELIDDEIIKDNIDINDIKFLKEKISHNKNNIQLYPDIPIQQYPTTYNPFEKEKFPFYNGIPSDFSCFMDYSPDCVLTHFTPSQSRIMHYMIRLFKAYLIKNHENEMKN